MFAALKIDAATFSLFFMYTCIQYIYLLCVKINRCLKYKRSHLQGTFIVTMVAVVLTA